MKIEFYCKLRKENRQNWPTQKSVDSLSLGFIGIVIVSPPGGGSDPHDLTVMEMARVANHILNEVKEMVYNPDNTWPIAVSCYTELERRIKLPLMINQFLF